MSEPLVIIFNPASGSTGDDFRTRLEKALRERGADFEIRETKPDVSGGELAARAVREGATQLLACGGDGTVMSVVNGLGKTLLAGDAPPVTLSIIPGGTANLLAAALDIPTDVDEAVEIALTGQDRAIDLGRCGDTLFALGLGLGLTERLVSQTSARQKETLGKAAYAWAMLREMGARSSSFSFKLDDGRTRRGRGVAVVVANCGDIGSGLKFAPDAKMDDGLIDLCVLHRFHLRDVVRLAWRSLRRELPADRVVSFYQARRVEIRSRPPLDLQIDGEVVDKMTPLVAEVLPRILHVRVPGALPNEAD